MRWSRGLTAVALRIAAVLLFALWWGGFTFYALIVVPTGTTVLGSATAQGFITQPVSDRLNLVGIVVIGILLWNLASVRRASRPRVRRVLDASWLVLLVTQLALIVLHLRLDEMVDAKTRSIVVEHVTFYGVHRAYLLVAAVQWLAAVVHAVAVGYAWSQASPVATPDRDSAPSVS